MAPPLSGDHWREGVGVQPRNRTYTNRVRVGVAGPGRRPSARQSALVCSGARWSGAALSGPGVLGYWSTGVLELVVVGERAVGFSPQPNGSEVGCALG